MLLTTRSALAMVPPEISALPTETYGGGPLRQTGSSKRGRGANSRGLLATGSSRSGVVSFWPVKPAEPESDMRSAALGRGEVRLHASDAAWHTTKRQRGSPGG